MNRIRKSKGFTLVEIMIVVLIIGILMAIAVPNFIKARSNSRLQTVVANLKQIESAKEQWAMETGQNATATPVEADLVGADKYMKAWPTGPITGTYAPQNMSTAPTFNTKNADAWKADTAGL